MNAKEAIKASLSSNLSVLKMYLADLTDADLLVRPVASANHIAWQMGHLIKSEIQLIGAIGCATASLPAGFAEKHTAKTTRIDSPNGFYHKQEYLELLDTVRAGTESALETFSDADFDKPNTGLLKDFAPTIGALFLLVANHTMMHAGQFSVVRRKLGKPVLF